MIGGRYDLVREIGRGGMGAVWLGRDELLGRPVAIKRTGMVPGAATTDQERAEREARLAARLSHPHIVAVFDLVDDDESQWLVMEYVDGVTLSKLVEQRGPLSRDRAAELMAQAADGLAAAHEAGIVHRDVKPSNILVESDGHVKLLDFGIARADFEKTLTATGLVTGSPAYMAPEVASGQPAGPASDVWSLGATAFHALSGRPPYEVGDNLMGALYRIVHEDPPRLDDAGWLAPLLDATMTKEVGQRWSMRQAHAFLAGGPAAAPVGHAGDGAATQVMTPVAYTREERSPAADPVTDQRPRRRRRAVWVSVGVLAAVALVVALVARAMLAGDGQESPPASSPTTDASSSPASGPEEPGPTEKGMEAFITDYLATAPSSPETTYEMLTPDFQQASGGFEGYSGFWSTIESAEPVDVTADPEAMTVAYTVAYVDQDGESSTDDVVLRLAFRDGRYLIADES